MRNPRSWRALTLTLTDPQKAGGRPHALGPAVSPKSGGWFVGRSLALGHALPMTLVDLGGFFW